MDPTAYRPLRDILSSDYQPFSGGEYLDILLFRIVPVNPYRRASDERFACSLLVFSEAAGVVSIARIERPPSFQMILPNSLAFSLLEGHACWSTCGRRTRPFSGRAFREHRTNVGVLPILFIVGALRAQRPCQLPRHSPPRLLVSLSRGWHPCWSYCAQHSHPPTHWQIFFTRPTLRLLRNRFPVTCH